MGMFGKQDTLYKVADTNLKDDSGKSIEICQHVTSYYFFAGLYARDDGLVVSSDRDRGYSEMPTGEELKQLQEAGLFPNPLPPHGLNFVDKLLGFSLWWLILAVIFYAVISTQIDAIKEKRNPKPVEPEEAVEKVESEAAEEPPA